MSEAHAPDHPDEEHFRFAPADDLPGWMTWDHVGPARFNAVFGPLRVRAERPGQSRVRMLPTPAHSNFFDQIHGGAMLAFMDLVMYPACAVQPDLRIGRASTIDLSAQFMRGARIDLATDAVVDILRETGRFVFVRGLVEQAGEVCAAFAGTIRKATR